MNTQTTQLKVTLPLQLHTFLYSRARRFGLTMSSYVKNLIIDDVKDMEIPVFDMSAKREKLAEKALADHKLGKTVKREI